MMDIPESPSHDGENVNMVDLLVILIGYLCFTMLTLHREDDDSEESSVKTFVTASSDGRKGSLEL